MMKRVLLIPACVAGLALCQAAHALTFNLNQEFSGGTPPSGTPPWVVITIADTIPNQVSITINNSGLLGTEFNSDTFLNVNQSVGPLSPANFLIAGSSGTYTFPGITVANNGNNADGGGNFDIQFAFEQSNQSGASERFGAGESVTYTVTAAGLDATDFAQLSVNPPGNTTWYAAAHIQSIPPNGGSGWIGASTPENGNGNGVPDGGSTMMLLGLAVGGMGWLRVRSRAA